MSIEVRGISKFYGAQKALDRVSMELKRGEIAGLLGPNGAGKSTLMKIITCFIPPDEGTALVNGFDIHQNSFEVRRSVGYLPEHNPLYYDMYVHEFLEFVSGLHRISGNRKRRVAEMIELTGLGLEQHKKIGTLSKGYRQRVGLAQAMIHDPQILILDEPTSGLDPNQLIEIRQLIRSIGKEKTVLFSTHIMQEVEALCSQVVIIDKGVIVADKPIEELSSLTTGIEIIKVEFNGPSGIAQLMKIAGVKKVHVIKENMFRLETDPKGDVRSEIFSFAAAHNLKVITIARVEQRLEEVFQHLTKKQSS
jgi:ABC-2 type transport system ATP-binding protein